MADLDAVKGGSKEVFNRRVHAPIPVREWKGLRADSQNGPHLTEKTVAEEKVWAQRQRQAARVERPCLPIREGEDAAFPGEGVGVEDGRALEGATDEAARVTCDPLAAV
jgi:hypothetical protein